MEAQGQGWANLSHKALLLLQAMALQLGSQVRQRYEEKENVLTFDKSVKSLSDKKTRSTAWQTEKPNQIHELSLLRLPSDLTWKGKESTCQK